ncbi:hypothetical protein SCHPADRAFT_908030 [Schizopora paradoxa]|uniref:Uncharacterized protein n=1 Tax=Schizopora paradoxa TaxID=27342 RepID=A0A0H2RWD8_9AGAM|nr:hypothetical protein SCHPADRAFT_908030 [Schizopora paradoxa]
MRPCHSLLQSFLRSISVLFLTLSRCPSPIVRSGFKEQPNITLFLLMFLTMNEIPPLPLQMGPSEPFLRPKGVDPPHGAKSGMSDL